jgi:hypothetical protein
MIPNTNDCSRSKRALNTNVFSDAIILNTITSPLNDGEITLYNRNDFILIVKLYVGNITRTLNDEQTGTRKFSTITV